MPVVALTSTIIFGNCVAELEIPCSSISDPRQEYEKDLSDSKFEENLKTMDPITAKQKADADSKDIMSTMAALHNPDQIVGGANSSAEMDMGLKNVNSSIGSGWGNKAKNESVTRVESIDSAVKGVDPNIKDSTKLNVKLHRCP